VPLHVTEEAELAVLANWREVTSGWMGADDARSVRSARAGAANHPPRPSAGWQGHACSLRPLHITASALDRSNVTPTAGTSVSSRSPVQVICPRNLRDRFLVVAPDDGMNDWGPDELGFVWPSMASLSSVRRRIRDAFSEQ
jgi:hypothetical protein